MPYRRPVRRDQIAVQLFSVRREMAADLPGTLRAVRAAGYDAVELAGLPDLPAAEIADRLGEADLRAIAAHERIDSLRGDPVAVDQYHTVLDDTAVFSGHGDHLCTRKGHLAARHV